MSDFEAHIWFDDPSMDRADKPRPRQRPRVPDPRGGHPDRCLVGVGDTIVAGRWTNSERGRVCSLSVDPIWGREED